MTPSPKRSKAMIRTLLSIVFLLALGAAIWFGVRWFETRDDLRATIVFDDAGDLRAGAPVLAGSLVIGRVRRVTPLESRDAVSVRVDSKHRDEMLIDSRFRVVGEGEDAYLEVASTFAFGRPVEDGDVLYARRSRLAEWIGEKGAPLVAKIRAEVEQWTESDVRERLEEWKRALPEWQRAGDAAVEENLEAVADRVNELERELRAKGRDLDAERLRRDFTAWLEDVKRRLREDEAETETAP